MPALKRSATALTLSLVCLAALAPQAAYADGREDKGNETTTPPPPRGSANEDGTLAATAGGIVFDRSKNGSGRSAGAVTSTTSWTPPACYYAPKYTPKEIEAQMRQVWGSSAPSHDWALKTQNHFVNGDPYKDFNKDKEGKGYWWDSYITEGREADPAAQDCDELPFWVDEGDAPPANAPQAITPEMLAQLAYAEIRVPGTEVNLAPEGTTKVNLPTWAWLDGAEFKPVSVTASVPVLGIQATTTAVPVSLRIEPGTEDAETYPASGECAIQDGRIGEPYAKGKSDETPPCGVKYLRSSGDGSYPLKATVTWKIHWIGTGVDGEQGLPDGEFGAEQDVIVQEIQSVNR